MGDESPVFNNPELVETLASGNLQFALNLYKSVVTQDENILLSPLGISATLAMTLGGTAGDTTAQMKQTMQLEAFEENEPIHLAFQDVLTALTSSTSEEEDDLARKQLYLATRLFLQTDVPVAEEFTTLLEQHYGANVDRVDFAQEADEARQTIDSWISEATDGKIRDSVGEGVIDLFSVLVLVSAVHFKGQWLIPFEMGSTELVAFQAGGGKQSMVDMMHGHGSFRRGVSDALECQALELPFLGGRMHMAILLPNEPDGLPTLESKLDSESLNELFSSLEAVPVHVKLPRFHVDCKFSLSNILGELGMPDVFTLDAANLSGMSGDEEGVLASELLHRAVLEIDEGAEGGECQGDEEEGEEFVADHPFLYLVRDNASQMIVLIGRLQTPETEELVL